MNLFTLFLLPILIFSSCNLNTPSKEKNNIKTKEKISWLEITDENVWFFWKLNLKVKGWSVIIPKWITIDMIQNSVQIHSWSILTSSWIITWKGDAHFIPYYVLPKIWPHDIYINNAPLREFIN